MNEIEQKDISDEMYNGLRDIITRRKMIELYGGENAIYYGTNGYGQNIKLTFSKEYGIVFSTFQQNKLTRIRYYDKNGYYRRLILKLTEDSD